MKKDIHEILKVLTKLAILKNNFQGFNNSNEESIGVLIPKHLKTESKTKINKGTKIFPDSKPERQDSKSTVKSSGQNSNEIEINNHSPQQIPPEFNIMRKISMYILNEDKKDSIINKYGNIDHSKNYTVLNELAIGSYFGEISALNNLTVTASVHTASDTICARMHK